MAQPSQVDDEYRGLAVESLDQNDWHGAYLWAKGWIGHGGAGLLDPWLVYVASALIHRQPRNASHSVDLALGGWFPDAADRAVLHFVRSRIVWHLLRDPKTARADLAAARPEAPDWLRPVLEADEPAQAADALKSRKRKPSVAPAPVYSGVPENSSISGLGDRRLPPGSRPHLWDRVSLFLVAPPPDP